MKKFCLYMFLLLIFSAVSGCSIQKDETTKINDLDYTVVPEEEIPQELMAQIESQKSIPFQLSYGDAGYLYIAQGYGEQPTSGYSVEVLTFYESENAICIATNLLGPDRGEELVEAKTYPYVVVKTEYMEKPVIYQ